MPTPNASAARPVRAVIGAAVATALLVAACATVETTTTTNASGRRTTTTAQPVETVEPPVTATSGASSPSSTADGSVSTDGGLPPAEFPVGIVPVRIEIPAIGVDAPVTDLDLRGDAPEVPTDFADTGWYEQTRLPGEIGPAVIAGHVDSVDGPAVFARLSLLEPGDEITVTAAGGEQRRFIVTRTGQYPKTDLPDEVFGFGEPVPELRLITCGGTFDRGVRHYVDNVVVYAVSSSQSPSAL